MTPPTIMFDQLSFCKPGNLYLLYHIKVKVVIFLPLYPCFFSTRASSASSLHIKLPLSLKNLHQSILSYWSHLQVHYDKSDSLSLSFFFFFFFAYSISFMYFFLNFLADRTKLSRSGSYRYRYLYQNIAPCKAQTDGQETSCTHISQWGTGFKN